MVDLDIVVIQGESEAVGRVPVQADAPHILLAAGDTAGGRAVERQVIQIDVAVARLDLPGAPATGRSQRMMGLSERKLAVAGS